MSSAGIVQPKWDNSRLVTDDKYSVPDADMTFICFEPGRTMPLLCRSYLREFTDKYDDDGTTRKRKTFLGSLQCFMSVSEQASRLKRKSWRVRTYHMELASRNLKFGEQVSLTPCRRNS